MKYWHQGRTGLHYQEIKIYASYGSLIGSIGVKGPDWIYYNNPVALSNGLLGTSIETKNGIKKFTNTAGNSKDIFNPFRKPTNIEIANLQKSVDNIYNDFVNQVSKNRKIDKKIIIKDIAAMIYETKEAEKNFLIDETVDLNKVIKIFTNNLKLNKYQIQKKKNNINFFTNNQISNILFQKYILKLDKKINYKICNNFKYGLSVIFIDLKLNSTC